MLSARSRKWFISLSQTNVQTHHDYETDDGGYGGETTVGAGGCFYIEGREEEGDDGLTTLLATTN